jgi:hypothetical protein
MEGAAIEEVTVEGAIAGGAIAEETAVEGMIVERVAVGSLDGRGGIERRAALLMIVEVVSGGDG